MKYRPEIDGLRALAVMPVIFYHAGFSLFRGGYVGVDVFFVISGYLITTIIYDSLEAGSFSLSQFYERRARRILPALFLVMLVCLPLSWVWLLPTAMKSFSNSLISVALFISNIFFYKTSGYFDSATELKPLIHTWSLAVEEQYYVVFPILLLFAWRLRKHWIAVMFSVIFIGSFILAQLLVSIHPSFDFFLLPTRAWELLMGAFIGLMGLDKNTRFKNFNVEQAGSMIGCLLIIFPIFYYDSQTPYPSVYTVAPTIGAALIIIFSTHRTTLGKLLGSRLFVGFGLISYSAYLWHQPIFAFARAREYGAPSSFAMGLLTFLSIVIAYLTWRFVESPFRNKEKFTRKQIFIFSIFGITFFCFAGLTLSKFDDYSDRLQATGVIGETGANEFYGYIKKNYPNCDDLTVMSSAPFFQTMQMCQQSRHGKVDLVLLGDSHAEYLFYGLSKALPNENVAYYVNWDKPYLTNPNFKNIFNSIAQDESIKTVILSMHYLLRLDKNGGDLYKNFKEVIAYLKALNKNIILVGDAPKYSYESENCKYKRRFIDLNNNACMLSIEEALKQKEIYDEQLKSLARDFQVEYIDIYPVFCDTNNCFMVRNNRLMYRDSDHISRYGSDITAQFLIKNSPTLRALSKSPNVNSLPNY